MINDLLRRRLAKIGMAPKPIHSPGSLDTFKAGLYPVMKGAVKLKNKLTGAANTASADEGY